MVQWDFRPFRICLTEPCSKLGDIPLLIGEVPILMLGHLDAKEMFYDIQHRQLEAFWKISTNSTSLEQATKMSSTLIRMNACCPFLVRT